MRKTLICTSLRLDDKAAEPYSSKVGDYDLSAENAHRDCYMYVSLLPANRSAQNFLEIVRITGRYRCSQFSQFTVQCGHRGTCMRRHTVQRAVTAENPITHCLQHWSPTNLASNSCWKWTVELTGRAESYISEGYCTAQTYPWIRQKRIRYS